MVFFGGEYAKIAAGALDSGISGSDFDTLIELVVSTSSFPGFPGEVLVVRAAVL